MLKQEQEQELNIINSILEYLCGNITPEELEATLPNLNINQWHKLAILRIAYEDSKVNK